MLIAVHHFIYTYLLIYLYNIFFIFGAPFAQFMHTHKLGVGCYNQKATRGVVLGPLVLLYAGLSSLWGEQYPMGKLVT